MNTLEHILNKYNVIPKAKGYTSIPASRDDFTILFKELGFKLGVEIGVARGEYGKILCSGNSEMLMYGIDPWEGYKDYRDFTSKKTFDGMYNDALKNLAGLNYNILKMYSIDALDNFKDGSLDFVYIDGNHNFLNVAQDICNWEKKVKVDGIVAGHDYKRSKGAWDNCTVDVVNAYTYSHKINPWFITTEHTSSWFWVKK